MRRLVLLSPLLLLASLPQISTAAEKLTELRLDYAYYSPASLVIRRFGWAEEAFRADGTRVRWVLSQGSNRALEYLNSGAVDFGSTAGLAALLARANGNPVRAVYVYSRPEWTALAVGKDSPIRTPQDLKGRKIAATKGTDPYLFLVRTLRTFGIGRHDVEIVHLQHPDGRVALEQGRVDAWAGLDPHLAAAELEGGARLLYRNPEFNTFGVLNTSESFLAKSPLAVTRVIAVYERARQWIVSHPQEAAQILAEEARLPIAVAKLQLQRTDFAGPISSATLGSALRAAAPVLADEGLVRKGVNLEQAVSALVEPVVGQIAARLE
ncbi:MAG: aliphatic sulfonate ABC transporter substrate-binding protein [Burkholderiales bacterium]|nr:aliphatic sulfonate ABC transporter substrate-binding protein [Burkholderiales bacterium]